MSKHKKDNEKNSAGSHPSGESQPEKEQKAEAQPEKKPEEKKEAAVSAEELKKLEEKAKLAEENYDKYLRAVADLDNYRKRALKEREDTLKFANSEFIKGLLPIMDNLDRAIANINEAAEVNKIREGIDIILKQFHKYLEQIGLEKIPAVGELFDPNKHHAVMQVESDEHPENVVIEEMQKGYLMHNRLVRPSMVKVAKKKS